MAKMGAFDAYVQDEQEKAERATSKGDWKIRIQGYGTFDFHGTEKEAEDMRAHKANWERGSGMKWRVGDWAKPSDAISQQMADLFDAGKGVPWKLAESLRKARKKEAA